LRVAPRAAKANYGSGHYWPQHVDHSLFYDIAHFLVLEGLFHMVWELSPEPELVEGPLC
jgi:hypothetical protein